MTIRIKTLLSIVLFVFPLFLNAQKKEAFTDVTQKAGIDFKYNFGDHTYVVITSYSIHYTKLYEGVTTLVLYVFKYSWCSVSIG